MHTVTELIDELEWDEIRNESVENHLYAVPLEKGDQIDVNSDNSDDEHEGNLNHFECRQLSSSCKLQQKILNSDVEKSKLHTDSSTAAEMEYEQHQKGNGVQGLKNIFQFEWKTEKPPFSRNTRPS